MLDLKIMTTFKKPFLIGKMKLYVWIRVIVVLICTNHTNKKYSLICLLKE